MIRLQDMVPAVYYNKSRDFQYIGRLYDIVLNATKTDIDTIRYINDPDTCDGTLLNLLAMTLGFKARRNYNAVQLRAICCVLSRILRSKGSIRALTTACDAILSAEGLKETADYSFKDGHLKIFLPYSLSDLSLIEDLFDYVLPAGISCTIVRELKVTKTALTEIGIQHIVNYYVDNTDTVGELQAELSVLADDNLNALVMETGNAPGMLGNVVIWQPVINAVNCETTDTTNRAAIDYSAYAADITNSATATNN